MSANKKTVGKYEIGRTLGEGTFGKVKLATNTETGEAVAIKVLDKERIQKQSMGSQIKKEISIMKQLQHTHIVKLTEVLASRTKIFIVLELVVGGELFDLIVKSGRLRERDARRYFRQLVNGVSYCHSQGVAHRDLKPENLLLDADGQLKISDFGLSALYDGENGASRSALLHTTCGTPNYVAPEVLENEGYDGRIADCWSIGVILYVLLAGFLPFDEPTMIALFQKIKAADYSYPEFFRQPVIDLIDTILVADPSRRATLADVHGDAWYTSEDDGAPAPPGEAPPAPTLQKSASAQKAAASLPKTASTRAICYSAPRPAQELGDALRAHLAATGAELVAKPSAPKGDDDDDDDEAPECRERIEATFKTANGIIAIVAVVSSEEDESSTLELLRGKGDILAYTAFLAGLARTGVVDGGPM